jgi:hypothetical protein
MASIFPVKLQNTIENTLFMVSEFRLGCKELLEPKFDWRRFESQTSSGSLLCSSAIRSYSFKKGYYEILQNCLNKL